MIITIVLLMTDMESLDFKKGTFEKQVKHKLLTVLLTSSCYRYIDKSETYFCPFYKSFATCSPESGSLSRKMVALPAFLKYSKYFIPKCFKSTKRPEFVNRRNVTQVLIQNYLQSHWAAVYQIWESRRGSCCLILSVLVSSWMRVRNHMLF